MSEQENKAPVPAQETLSPRRRTALVSYLAILFAAAFLFVAIVMVMETRRLKTMNQELQDSSQKTSASLTSNINALQSENQKLSENNGALSARIEALEEAASLTETELEGLRAEVERLTKEAADSETARASEAAAFQSKIDALTKKAEDAVAVSELLQQAIAADESGDMEGLQTLLEQIEEFKELLSPTEAEIYESLIID